ncbi:amidohydrolase family protein [Streptomyces cellostaticus]|uniref:amidohydrolase family protein n=1 Tax=Streptomyces cellostaticus TaxID=67285 RepID=UPI000AF1D862|nr:amidohydrolase family protein [Streptomyces cellostaticus]GHI10477.1 hypothetical protein Scel_87980 [Streptomyces cellostaticus]
MIGRDADGRLNGRLIDNALGLVERLVPAEGRARRIDGLRLASGRYAATGIGTVRDCAVSLDDYAVLLAAREAGALSTRVRALISAIGLSSAAEVEDLLDAMEDWRYCADPWLRVWGVKFGLDGGLEAGATEEPYACDHAFSGTLTWEPDALVEAVEAVVRRGWRVGTHAYGDRAVRILLDVYERVLRNNPGLPAGTLVMEHGGLAGPEQRARAVALGIPVTIQQPLLHDTAEVERGFWGPERVAALFPAREWLDQGALVTAAHYFADLRATVAMVFRTWPVAREYASTPCLATALDTEYTSRIAQAEPLLNTAGKKKTSKPYTAPPTDPLAAGAVLDIAVQLLQASDPHEARKRLTPLAQHLRDADRALSTYLRRPTWISKPLRNAVSDDWPVGKRTRRHSRDVSTSSSTSR